MDTEDRETGPVAWARWNSEIGMALRDYKPEGPPLEDAVSTPGVWGRNIPLPEAARNFLGKDAAVKLTARQHV